MASQSEQDAIALGQIPRIDENVPNSDSDSAEVEVVRDDNYTEEMHVKRQDLTMTDVASLVLNKMIGTGIFTTPGFILNKTNSKGLSVALWGIGGLYCWLCLLIYLDYGDALPFNGGELNYLNKVWPLPELLTAVMFAGFFISLGHTAGNAVAFSRHILLAAMPTPLEDPNSQPPLMDLDARLVKSYAILVLGIVCLLLWISPKMGLFMNRLLALYKIILLLVVGFAGISARNRPDSGNSSTDWKQSDTGYKSTSALIYIIYSYTGWENANYIIGDIKTKRRDLRRGAFAAVVVVTFLYILVNVGYFLACKTQDIVTPQSDIGLAVVFANKIFGHTTGLKVCIAISAIGNLIATAYTCSKVKQAIALYHFIPYSQFFARDDHFLTPGGALLLHWICSSIVVLAMPNDSDGYAFIIGLFTYGQLLVGFALGLGLPRLKKAMGTLKYGQWRPFISAKWANWACGLLLAGLNVVVLIGAAVPPYDAGTKRYLWPAILGSIELGSVLWWLGLRLLQRNFGDKIGWTAEVVQVADLNDLTTLQRDERRDGVEKMVEYKVPETGLVGKTISSCRPLAKWLKEKTY